MDVIATSPDDLAAGIPLDRESVNLAQPPGQPMFGENHAFWLHDDATGIQINGHISTGEDIGAYDCRIGKMSLTFPDGRLYLLRERGRTSTPDTAASPTLRFRCVEPFRRWRCSFDGAMADCTISRAYLTAAPLDPYPVPVRFEIEAEMVAPAWMQGTIVAGGLGPVEPFIGGERYEQLLSNGGTLWIGGVEYPFAGQGNRTHRWGARDLNASATAPRMLGHTWATAIFPSGAGFGFQIYPTEDGGILWSEGHILRDGRLTPARVVRAPWLRNYWWGGEEFSIVLASDSDAELEIRGVTLSSVITQMLPAALPAEQIPIVQTCARFSANGETAINMMERSLRRVAIETGKGRPQ